MFLCCDSSLTNIDARQVSWWGSSIIMMKTQIGLGVLSIPAAFDALGLIPGIISLAAIGGITLWSGYMVGVFKRRHPEVYGIEDVGQKLFGRAGREVLGLAFALCGSPYLMETWFSRAPEMSMWTDENNSVDVRRWLRYAGYLYRIELVV
jgi:hypothetical protein